MTRGPVRGGGQTQRLAMSRGEHAGGYYYLLILLGPPAIHSDFGPCYMAISYVLVYQKTSFYEQPSDRAEGFDKKAYQEFWSNNLSTYQSKNLSV